MDQKDIPSHIAPDGGGRMVDVSAKEPTRRRAAAEGRVRVNDRLHRAIAADDVAKGNLLEAARLAGIAAAKRTSELIPLCHNLPLDHAEVEARLEPDAVFLRAQVTAHGRTGVEMEALAAVAVAALTVVDMGKSLDRGMAIEGIRVVEKSGGRSGDFRAGDPGQQETRP